MTTRHLAAILAVDMVGYSRLMGADEEGTLARLQALRREIIDPCVTGSGGHVVKSTGDGILAEFPSAVEAVRCALAMQEHTRSREAGQAPEQRIEFRIGINVGDVIASEGDIHGDGVNIAVRLEALAEAGGIVVSANAHAMAAGRLQCGFEDIGEQVLKNIVQPVRAYRVRSTAHVAERPALALPDKPSLAVLPFQNMSGDPEQEYFVDGLVEDITTALSCVRSLFVIARNSAFTYKGRAVDIRRVGRELGVRYVLEGSVRKAGSRLRITGQLIEAASGTHLWANRFDGTLEDVFDLQDSITKSVAGILAPTITDAEIERAQRKRPENLTAYDLTLQAVALIFDFTPDSLASALKLAREAIRRDPRYARAHAFAAWALFSLYASGGASFSEVASEALGLMDRALRADRSDPHVLSIAGILHTGLAHDVTKGISLHEEALALNPNDAWCLANSALLLLRAGDCRRAIEQIELAMRLSPRDHFAFLMIDRLATSHLLEGDVETAYRHAVRCVQIKPDYWYGHAILASTAALLGKEAEATAASARLLALAPSYRIADRKGRIGRFAPEKWEVFFEGLRRAGVPE